MKRVLTIDIGATNTRMGIGYEIKDKPYLLDVVKVPTPDNPNELLSIIQGYARGRDFHIVSVATIGPLDVTKGWLLHTPNKKLGPFPIRERIEDLLGKKTVVINDCQAAVWGEHVYGRYKGNKNMVYLTLSTGVGAGVIIDGHLLFGKKGNAHEVGHIVIDYDSSVKCGCGGEGHWEAFAGASNIYHLAKHLMDQYNVKSPFYYKTASGEITAEMLTHYYSKGDPFAVHVFNKLVEIQSAGIASIIAAYDPSIIVLGGSFFYSLKEPILDGVRRVLPRFTRWYKDVILSESSFPNIEPMIGALAIVSKPPN